MFVQKSLTKRMKLDEYRYSQLSQPKTTNPDQSSFLYPNLLDQLNPKHRPDPGAGGPSWLTFIGHMKDSLWSVDLFRCESITLKTHWVLVVMDQFTRRIIGFGTQAGAVDGIALCRMFNHAIAGQGIPR